MAYTVRQAPEWVGMPGVAMSDGVGHGIGFGGPNPESDGHFLFTSIEHDALANIEVTREEAVLFLKAQAEILGFRVEEV